jgi:hypothetical protein
VEFVSTLDWSQTIFLKGYNGKNTYLVIITIATAKSECNEWPLLDCLAL